MSIKNIMSKTIKSCLSENDLLNDKTIKPNKYINLFSFNTKRHKTKNLFNNISNLKLKGKEKYNNFSLFTKREMNSDKNSKLRLNLSLKKYPSLIKYKNNIMHNSLYLSQNVINGDFSKLPLLLENINIKDYNHRKFSNSFRTKDIEKEKEKGKKNSNTNKEEINNKNVRALFLNKLKFNKKNKLLKKQHMNETDGYLLNKKSFSLTRYKNSDSSSFEYIDKLHEYFIFKNNMDLKRELLLQTNDFNSNKLEKVEDEIKSLNDNKRLEENFLEKFNEYLKSLFLEIDMQNNKDIILCEHIYNLRAQIKILENKIRKLKKEKFMYIRWMFLQIQIKEKILNLPYHYNSLLNDESKNGKVKNEEIILKYKNNIIYKNPEEMMKQLKKYENENINLINELNEIKADIFPLKNELEIENKNILNDFYFKEIINKNKIKQKLMEKYNTLENKKMLLNKNHSNLSFNNINSNSFNNIKHSKLYEKIKLLKNNIIGDKQKTNYINKTTEESEMVKMLWEIELAVNECLSKQKLYMRIYNDKFEEEKGRLEKYKRIYKVKLHQKDIYYKSIKLEEKINQKSQKIYIFPKKKINWTNFKFKKSNNSLVDERNAEKEDLYEYIKNIDDD